MQLYAPDGTLRHTNRSWEANVLQDAQVDALGHLPSLQQVLAGEAVTLPPSFYNAVMNGHASSDRWLEGTVYPVKTDTGEVQAVVFVTKDRTEAKRAEPLLQATLEATAEGLLVLDRQGKVVNFNTHLLEMWDMPDSVLAALGSGQNESMLAFALEQLVAPEAFLPVTSEKLSQLESETCDRLELKNGRVFECYSRLQWLDDRCLGKVLSFRDVTEHSQAARALQRRSQQTTAVIDLQQEIAAISPDLEAVMALIVDRVQVLTHGSGAVIEMVEGDELVYRAANGLAAAHVGLRLKIATSLSGRCIETGEILCCNDTRWTLWHNRMLFDAQGQLMEFQAVGRDITALKQTEAKLFHEKELAQVALRSIGDAVITTDATGRIEYLNPVAEALTVWTQAEAQGCPVIEVFKIVHESTREPAQNPIEPALQERRIVGLVNHTVLIARQGQELAIEDSAAPIRDREGQIIGAVMVFHDVTHTRTLARQLTWQASHDALTGLVNRREFEQRVEQALNLAKLDHQVHALCYLDLDRFKIVNDTCGHVAGDELLRQITGLLQEKIRKADTLARLGGDEFGILLNQCPLEQALRVANTLRECVQAFRFVWQEQVFTIGASIGLVSIDAESESLAEIISAADAACYTAKHRGRNRVYVAQTDDQERLQQRGEMQWVNRITQALENDHFCLYAQPIAAVTSESQEGNHDEVLIRLQDEQENLTPPMAFIPAAERYDLMHLIDRWVVRTLFEHWSAVVSDDQSIYAINLSGSSINDDQFIDFLHEQFALHPISPQRLCFEITETVAIANLTKASQSIQELQRLGCRFALDDFGAGMSSFAYLKSLLVDYLKIDGSFIRNIVENDVDDAIVSAIIQIGNVMGIRTIAEFVENDAILDRIR